MARRILITGATGFLGFSILEKIIENGDIPYVLVRNDSNLSKIKSLLNVCKVFYYKTLQDEELILSLIELETVDSFIHCAWKGVEQRNDSSQITYNVSFTIDSIVLAHKINCKRWVGIGSQAEYGAVNAVAMEDSTPIKPFSIYGKAKASCYWAASALCQAYSLEMVWCRVFSLYGPNDNPNYLIPYVIKNLLKGTSPSLTSCQQKWDYLYVSDGANAIVSIANSKVTGIFNVGSGQTIILKEVVEYLKQALNPTIQINFGEVTYTENQILHLEASIDKINQSLNWHPRINLEEGLSKTLFSYRQTYTHL